MTPCARCGTTSRQINPASLWCLVCLNGPPPTTERHPTMQRILRWEVPVNDQWHDIGTGYVTHVASRTHRKQPGDLVEVWTLEDIEGDAMRDVTKLPMRKATVIGTGHKVPDGFVEHIGSAVVPTFHLDGKTGKTIRSSAGLVWHVFAQYHPAAERQRLMEEGQRIASQTDDLIGAEFDRGLAQHDADILKAAQAKP